jgi:hypothetical protein
MQVQLFSLIYGIPSSDNSKGLSLGEGGGGKEKSVHVRTCTHIHTLLSCRQNHTFFVFVGMTKLVGTSASDTDQEHKDFEFKIHIKMIKGEEVTANLDTYFSILCKKRVI